MEDMRASYASFRRRWMSTCSVIAGASLSVILGWGQIEIIRYISSAILILSVVVIGACIWLLEGKEQRLIYMIREVDRAERIMEMSVLTAAISLHPQILEYAGASNRDRSSCDGYSATSVAATAFDRDRNQIVQLAAAYAKPLAITELYEERLWSWIEIRIQIVTGSVLTATDEILSE